MQQQPQAAAFPKEPGLRPRRQGLEGARYSENTPAIGHYHTYTYEEAPLYHQWPPCMEYTFLL